MRYVNICVKTILIMMSYLMMIKRFKLQMNDIKTLREQVNPCVGACGGPVEQQLSSLFLPQ